jgi:ATP-dependent exoDNAse (exonuclease V) beta subunit
MPAHHPLAADTGTLIHKYLELIAQDGLAAWPIARLQACLPAMQHWFVQQGHPTATAQAAATTVLQHLLTTCQTQDGQWVLSPHPQARSEWAQATPSDQGGTVHIIDRTFVCDGIRWIIDYKTTSEALPNTEAWAQQLQRYAQLFGTEQPIQTAILLTLTGELLHANR